MVAIGLGIVDRKRNSYHGEATRSIALGTDLDICRNSVVVEDLLNVQSFIVVPPSFYLTKISSTAVGDTPRYARVRQPRSGTMIFQPQSTLLYRCSFAC